MCSFAGDPGRDGGLEAAEGNRLGRIDLADLDSEKRYSGVRAYNNAKLALIVFTRELDRRYRSRGLAGAAFSPGIIASNFAQQPGDANGWIAQSTVLRRLIGASPESGAPPCRNVLLAIAVFSDGF